MAYGIDKASFLKLQETVRALPERPPPSPREVEALLYAFLDAFATLLSLVQNILMACAERRGNRAAVGEFLPVFNAARERILSLLESEFREGLEARSPHLIDFAYAVRESFVADEMVILDRVLEKTADAPEPKEDGEIAHTVTDSVKKLLGKYTKKKFIGPVLHALNEVISLILG
ncbi:MAG: hypothetical protein ACRD5Z_23555 [Bryobacteraceae bacterium]